MEYAALTYRDKESGHVPDIKNPCPAGKGTRIGTLGIAPRGSVPFVPSDVNPKKANDLKKIMDEMAGHGFSGFWQNNQ